MVEDQVVRVGTGAVRHLGWSFHHLHDQHFRCSFIPAYRLPGGEFSLCLLYVHGQFNSRIQSEKLQTHTFLELVYWRDKITNQTDLVYKNK